MCVVVHWGAVCGMWLLCVVVTVCCLCFAVVVSVPACGVSCVGCGMLFTYFVFRSVCSGVVVWRRSWIVLFVLVRFAVLSVELCIVGRICGVLLCFVVVRCVLSSVFFVVVCCWSSL